MTTKGSKQKRAPKKLTVPSYTFEDTSDPNLKRYVDRYGNWTHYYLVKEQVFLPGVTSILGMGYAKGPRFYEYLLSVSPAEAKQKLQAAGDEGTRTHMAIRQLIDGSKVTMTTKYPVERLGGRQEPLNPDEWDNLVAFTAFCERYKPQVISNDFATYSVTWGFAGSPDALLIVTVPDKDKAFPKEVWGREVVFLPDWKTSGAIYNEYKAQVAAYWRAVSDGGKFLEFFKGSPKFTGIVRLGTRHKNGGFEVEVWDEAQTEKNFLLFLSAQEIYKDQMPEWKNDVEEIPLQFYVKLPKAKVKSAPKKRAAKKAPVAEEAKDAPLFSQDNQQQ